MANKATAGLKIDIDSRSAIIAKRRLDKLTAASDEYGKSAEQAAKEAAEFDSAITDMIDDIKNMITGTNGATSALAKIPFGTVAGAATLATGAVIGLGAAAVALGQKTRDAARELNQGLLDAIEDSSRGSEELTAQFEDTENVMRSIRGETELLARGYDNVEEATAASTEEFARNEAVVRDLDRVLPRLDEMVGQLLVDSYVALRSEVIDTNASLISQEVAAGQALATMERLRDFMGSAGTGVEAIGQMGSAVAGDNEELANSFDLVTDAMFANVMESGNTAQSAQELLTLYAQEARALQNRGILTNDQRLAVLSLAGEEDARAALLSVGGLAQQEFDRMLNEQSTPAVVAHTGAVREEVEEIDNKIQKFKETEIAISEQEDAIQSLIFTGTALVEIYREIGAANAQARKEMLQTTSDANSEMQQAFDMAAKEDMGAKLDAQLSKTEARTAQAASIMTGAFQQIGQAITGSLTQDGEKASKAILRLIGDLLVGLGTAALAQGAIAVIPTLFNPAGTPAQGVALLAAGAAATAVGVGMGAAAGPRATPQSIQGDPGGGDAGPSSVNNTYNVAFDSFTPERGRNRAVIEQVGSSIESAA